MVFEVLLLVPKRNHDIPDVVQFPILSHSLRRESVEVFAEQSAANELSKMKQRGRKGMYSGKERSRSGMRKEGKEVGREGLYVLISPHFAVLD